MRIGSGLRKRAISELFATLLMVVVTLIAGAAVLGWVNGQAGSSERAYGNSAANNINYLNERFAVESQIFSGTGASGQCSGGTPPYTQCTGASFYLYNDGSLNFTLYSIQVVSTNSNYPLNIVFYSACATSGSCSNPSSNSREVVTAPSPCTVASPCNPPIVTAGGGSPPTGFYLASGYKVVPSLSVNTLSTGAHGPYQITLPAPASTGQLYMYDTVAYSITFTGLYGNTVQETLTANG